MNNDLIRFVLSLYNARNYVKEAIFSIINKVYKSLEILILNDGYTDNSKNIILVIDNDKM